MPKISDFEFRQGAAMSQQLAELDSDYVELAGADPTISRKIQRIKIWIKHGFLDGKDKDVELLLDMLNGDRKAIFATSEKVNEITKMGLQMPKKMKEVNMSDRG